MINNLNSQRCERRYNPRLWPDSVTGRDKRLKPEGDRHGVHDVAQGELAGTFVAVFDADRYEVGGL